MKDFLRILTEFGVGSFLLTAVRETVRRMWSNETHHVYSFDLSHWHVEERLPTLHVREATRQEIHDSFVCSPRSSDSGDTRKRIEIFLFGRAQIPMPYIGLVNEKPVVLCWMITSEFNDAVQEYFKGGVMELKQNDVLLEFIYTLPAFRGSSYMEAMTKALFDIARRAGKERALALVNSENTSSIRGSAKIGWAPLMTKEVTWRFFGRKIDFLAPATYPI